MVDGVRYFHLLLSIFFISAAVHGLAATQTGGSEVADQKQLAEDRQRIMGGLPTRAELKIRRARATNAPVSFSINAKTERLEARDIDGALIQEYAPGAVGHLLDVGGYELKVSFGR
ncbi:hypothetical protein EBS57_10735, partial [bacterium]|nr:hypothetical protein [bacterium]